MVDDDLFLGDGILADFRLALSSRFRSSRGCQSDSPEFCAIVATVYLCIFIFQAGIVLY